jgi:hypothetical protein
MVRCEDRKSIGENGERGQYIHVVLWLDIVTVDKVRVVIPPDKVAPDELPPVWKKNIRDRESENNHTAWKDCQRERTSIRRITSNEHVIVSSINRIPWHTGTWATGVVIVGDTRTQISNISKKIKAHT